MGTPATDSGLPFVSTLSAISTLVCELLNVYTETADKLEVEESVENSSISGSAKTSINRLAPDNIILAAFLAA
jgi:hypothetical protein